MIAYIFSKTYPNHGVWGSHEAEKSYRRFIVALLEAPVLSSSPTLPPKIGGNTDLLIAELTDAFLDAHEEKLHGHAHQFNTTVTGMAQCEG